MNTRLSRQDGDVRVNILVDGRAKSLVKIGVGEDNLLTDMVDVCSEAARTQLLEKVPAGYRDAVGVLLRSLVSEVADWRMSPAPQPPVAPSALDNGLYSAIEPASDPVDLDALFDRIAGVIAAHVSLPGDVISVIPVWVVHTYCLDAADFSPYLWVRSATRECGKSTLIDLLAKMARRALKSANASTAALFRMIDGDGCTLFLDDIDSWIREVGHAEINSILNSGFKRGTPCIRMEADADGVLTPRAFRVFGPKVLAGIGRRVLVDTTASRTIRIDMQKQPKGVTARLAKIRERDAEQLGAPIRGMAARWALDHVGELTSIRPVMPPALYGRNADMADPLLAILSFAGPTWRARGEAALVRLLTHADDHGDAKSQLLADIKRLFDERKPPGGWFSSVELVEALQAIEESPWGDWRNGRGLTTRALAELLGDFEIRAQKGGARVDRMGYAHAQFAGVWASYAVGDPQTALPLLRQSSASSDSLRHKDLGQYESSAAADDLNTGKLLWHNNAEDAEDENEGSPPDTSANWGASSAVAQGVQASLVATAKLDRLLNAEAERAVKV